MIEENHLLLEYIRKQDLKRNKIKFFANKMGGGGGGGGGYLPCFLGC